MISATTIQRRRVSCSDGPKMHIGLHYAPETRNGHDQVTAEIELEAEEEDDAQVHE